eukprot:1937046-Rhodomonas_salina.2
MLLVHAILEHHVLVPEPQRLLEGAKEGVQRPERELAGAGVEPAEGSREPFDLRSRRPVEPLGVLDDDGVLVEEGE